MKKLSAAALSVVAAVAGAAPAQGASFSEPRTLADWAPGASLLVAGPGAAAWTHPEGMRFSVDGGSPVRIPGGEGMVQDVAVGAPAARPFAAWVDSRMRLHAYTERDDLVAGTMDRVRAIDAAPSALAWIGVEKDDARKLQVALRRSDGRFDAARTPEQLGRPVFDVSAAGDDERSLVVWPVQEGGARRIELLEIEAGRVQEPHWLTDGSRDATSPIVAVGPGGSGLAAWVDGMPAGHVTAMPVGPDGALGDAQPLDTEPGGSPDLAIGPGGAAVAAWPAGGDLRVALRSRGAARFSAPVTLPAENLYGWSAAVTRAGDTIVSWLDAEAGASLRAGARLMAAVAPPGGALGAPVEVADHVLSADGAGDTLTWAEIRAGGSYETERRVRYARLQEADSPDGGPGAPGAADRRAPRVKLRVLGARGRKVRVQVRSDERAALRARWRRGARVVGRAGGTLRAGRPRVLRVKAPAGTRRVALTVRATDAAGNTRTVRRTIRLRRAR